MLGTIHPFLSLKTLCCLRPTLVKKKVIITHKDAIFPQFPMLLLSPVCFHFRSFTLFSQCPSPDSMAVVAGVASFMDETLWQLCSSFAPCRLLSEPCTAQMVVGLYFFFGSKGSDLSGDLHWIQDSKHSAREQLNWVTEQNQQTIQYTPY